MVIQRFEALSKICDGFENLLSGNILTAESEIKSGMSVLESIKDPVFTDVNYGIMYHAVEQEISICEVVLNIIEILNFIILYNGRLHVHYLCLQRLVLCYG